jgi:hypothetical protein
VYLEFGVYRGESMRWWVRNAEGWFYGFDTFEGIPEPFGGLGKMNAEIPDIAAHFVKGKFQETLIPFLKLYHFYNRLKVIHLDADLFSSTLFVLATIHPYLCAGDIIIFDEFNCPNHEFAAYKIFTDCFDVKMELIYEVNNYHQVAFKIV